MDMKLSRLLPTAGALVALAVLTTTPAGARFGPSYPTPVTFNIDVQLPGKTLPAGNYVFERANPSTSADVVLVRNKRGTVQWMGLTNPVERRKAGKTVVELSEAPRGEAPRVLTWFPSGSVAGSAFIY